MSLSESEATAAIAFFNASRGRIPYVPGHPRDDQPALGYATALDIDGGKIRVTEEADVDASFAAIVASGELPARSIKLRFPTHPDNTSGVYEIRHIGFLGRTRAAIEDLNQAEFSAGEHEAIFSFDCAIEPTGAEADAAPSLIPTGATPMSTEAKTPDTSQQEAEFAAKQAELAERERKLAEQELTFQRAQASQPWVRDQLAAGKLLPAEADSFVALLSQLPTADLTFARDGEETAINPVDFLKEFVERLPSRVTYGEVSGQSEAEFNAKPEADPATARREFAAKLYASRRVAG